MDEFGLLFGDEPDRHGQQPGEAIRTVVLRFCREYVRFASANATSRLDDLEALARFADRYSDSEAFLGEITLLAELSGEDNDVN